ncbi:hypothetical protein [Archangium violaceum]|uniref:hypothetical protein n=1 Tax=Archangium violaceum TaxID=83451 RepID=UPI0037C1AFD6
MVQQRLEPGLVEPLRRIPLAGVLVHRIGDAVDDEGGERSEFGQGDARARLLH